MDPIISRVCENTDVLFLFFDLTLVIYPVLRVGSHLVRSFTVEGVFVYSWCTEVTKSRTLEILV